MEFGNAISTLGDQGKILLALSPAVATGIFYGGAAATSLGFRIASIATEFFGKNEQSDQIENSRQKIMAFVNKNIQHYAPHILGLTAVTASSVLIHHIMFPPEETKLELAKKFISDIWNRK